MPPTMASFHLFTSLPPELRFEIWHLSCQPRVVEVAYDRHANRCTSTTRPPAILHACRESRDEGLRIYRPAFTTSMSASTSASRAQSRATHTNTEAKNTTTTNTTTTARATGTIFFSPALDILYLPRQLGPLGYDDTYRDFGAHVFQTVEYVHRLAIDHVQPDVRRPWETYNKFSLIQSFPHLVEAYLVLSPSFAPKPKPQQLITGPTTATAPVSSTAMARREKNASTGTSARLQQIKGGDGQDLALVDPVGDPCAVLHLMDRVLESFCYEVGPEAFGASDLRGQAVSTGASSRPSPACLARRAPPLVPKAKTYVDTTARKTPVIQCN